MKQLHPYPNDLEYITEPYSTYLAMKGAAYEKQNPIPSTPPHTPQSGDARRFAREACIVRHLHRFMTARKWACNALRSIESGVGCSLLSILFRRKSAWIQKTGSSRQSSTPYPQEQRVFHTVSTGKTGKSVEKWV